jgi:hypothetical protein
MCRTIASSARHIRHPEFLRDYVLATEFSDGSAVSAIALTAAALIGYLIEEYQPPDAARVEIETVP